MLKIFIKTKNSGCGIKALKFGIKNTTDGKMYLLGSHDHLTICDICKKNEENDEDTLHDMWLNDNITNDYGYADWKEYKNN
jgi:hypothetical protein